MYREWTTQLAPDTAADRQTCADLIRRAVADGAALDAGFMYRCRDTVVTLREWAELGAIRSFGGVPLFHLDCVRLLGNDD